MFVNAIKKVKKAAFPIFRIEKIEQNQTMKIGVCGTGFFIDSNGMFATVAHIFDDRNENTQFCYWGLLPENLINPWITVQEYRRDDDKDIFIGKVSIQNNDFLQLASGLPDTGKSVCIMGYPLAVITQNQSGGAELGGVRRYFQPSFVLDNANSKSVSLTGKFRTHDGFLVRDFGLFGMSGGPVIDIDGTVWGIQASVTNPRVSEGPGGRKISVENAIAIKADNIKAQLENVS